MFKYVVLEQALSFSCWHDCGFSTLMRLYLQYHGQHPFGYRRYQAPHDWLPGKTTKPHDQRSISWLASTNLSLHRVQSSAHTEHTER